MESQFKICEQYEQRQENNTWDDVIEEEALKSKFECGFRSCPQPELINQSPQHENYACRPSTPENAWREALREEILVPAIEERSACDMQDNKDEHNQESNSNSTESSTQNDDSEQTWEPMYIYEDNS